MRPKCFFILSLLFVVKMSSAVAQDNFISREYTSLIAVNFFYERAGDSFDMEKEEISVAEIIDVTSKDVVLYRICKMLPYGWVMVSGTDKVIPVLAYGLNKINISRKPENFSAWMKHWENELYTISDKNIIPSEEIRNEWARLSDPDFCRQRGLRAVEPMLISIWNQDYPYNALCPEDPDGPHGRTYAGCVATAMGQLMYFYRWPETGTGSYSYEHPDYGTISADFENATYEWEEMCNDAGASNLAIAKLLYHLGVSVDMDYGPNGSGMWNHKAAYSLRTYFKFSPETEYVFRDSTSMSWDSLVLAHLDRQMPCYYAGWAGVGSTSGHAFVVDGYQTSDYFHFNWGWGGSWDGYFYLDNLTPGGSNFNYAQELIINAYPDTLNYTYPSFCNGNTELKALKGTFEDGSGPHQNYLNNTNCSWLINPQSIEDSVSTISISFDRFSLDESDQLLVYDGPDSNAPLMAAISGSELPASLSSTGNTLFLQLQSDASLNADGFYISYQSQLPQWCSGMTSLLEPEANFDDGSGDFYYHNNTICQWRIMPPETEAIQLDFISFDTEEDKDVLKIIDMNSQNVIATLSGNTLPESMFCPTDKLLLLFSTNESNKRQGWEIHYRSSLVGMDANTAEHISIYPNPAGEILNISGATEFELNTIRIFSMEGQLIKQISLHKTLTNYRLDLGGMSNGIYLLEIGSGGSMSWHKLVK